MARESLIVRGAREHNLRNIDLELPREALVVITGLSGSGKSSLAFDTIYAEGQRRYVESLSAYARQFLGLMEKPDVDAIEGLSPAISIEQKTVGRNPRSTVGTVTEVYDYLRLLWARVGIPHCPECGEPVIRQSSSQIVSRLLEMEEGTRIEVFAPLVRGRKGEFKDLFERARKEGFVRVRADGEVYDLSDPPTLNRYENHDIAVVVDRLVVKPEDRDRLADSVETGLRAAGGVVEVVEQRGKEPLSHLFSERYACPNCGISLAELEPRQFSFNSPFGACEECGGLGTRKEVNPDLLVSDPSLSILEGVILPWGEPSGHLRNSILAGLAQAYEFDPKKPWSSLPPEAQEALLVGSGKMKIRFPYHSKRFEGHYEDHWEGVVGNVERRYRETKSEAVRNQLEDYLSTLPCTACHGSRLNPQSLAVTVGGRSLGDVVDLSIDRALEFLVSLPVEGESRLKGAETAPGPRLPGEIAGPILKEVRERLGFLVNVGLDYLTLGRSADSLSGGEAQRIRLATQIGSRLVGVLYILDEPSIGLHQRDNDRLLETLKRLRDLGNTVIVVEHDEDTIRAADYVVDLGPGAGRAGGEVVVRGSVRGAWSPKRSLTGAYLRGERSIPAPDERRRMDPERALRGAGGPGAQPEADRRAIPPGDVHRRHRGEWLGEVHPGNGDPLPRSCPALLPEPGGWRAGTSASTGWSSWTRSSRSTSPPIGRTPRSNPATYTGLFTPIRELFSRAFPSRRCGGTLPAASPST